MSEFAQLMLKFGQFMSKKLSIFKKIAINQQILTYIADHLIESSGQDKSDSMNSNDDLIIY